ncbi:gliding motility lipoprotein GldB [Allomuricauda sp. d1]|uniref:gliding motility lipoprotein GldB n=1 Tax=Allomuricauda sp. d1 TaxID=3136725 RepID=UPI0031CDFE83
MKRFREFMGCFALLLIILFIGCKDDTDGLEAEIAKISINFELLRFDQQFGEAKAEDIPKLKQKYPYLFPAQYPDSVWEATLNDTLQIALHKAVDSVFTDFDEVETDLESLFKHIAHYFPRYKVPKTVTLISRVDYNNRVILSDSLLLIGLDNYLGHGHKFYAGLSNYIAKGLDKKYLTSDVASAFAKTVNPYPRDRTFLSRMVHYGKELYLKDKLLPNATDAQKIGYTDDEMGWAKANEEQMWRHFIEQELLYSTDSSLDRKFLDPAPFSKFGLELDSESPGRLGRYLGWQIVRAYAEKNDNVGLIELLDMPADELFKKSNYKPRR